MISFLKKNPAILAQQEIKSISIITKFLSPVNLLPDVEFHERNAQK
jgi:hypothetical protein